MWFRIAACVAWSTLWVSSAAAQRASASSPVRPGVQTRQPVEAGELGLAQAANGRRAVRGCPLGQDCVPPHQQLRMIELELFPQGGGDGDPWRDEVRGGARGVEGGNGAAVRKPSELRADLAWLDDLEMPDLPVRWTPKLVEYLQFYKDDPRGRNIMRGWLVAAGRYRELILGQLRGAGLPLDLLYVAMIESSFEPGESSSVGAAGLWQFMPAGGKIYGLLQNHWVDERRDPLRSTVAAMDYWRDLYQRFGDWNLAMAAYNAGYGAILRSIARYNTNDYWQLCLYENALAWEATLYVPKALAVAIVGHNLEVFGFADVQPEAPDAWEEVTVPVSMALGVIAKASGTTSERIKKLNPQLRRNRTPPEVKNYVVRVPRGAKADFGRRLAELQTEWDGYDAYVVAYGERFEDVAATFGISRRKLRQLNELSDDSEMGGGSVLVVPRVSADQRAKNRAVARAALHESGVDQQAGEQMIVALPSAADAEMTEGRGGRRRGFYRVIIGDTLTGVAKALGVKPSELTRWNGLDEAANLHPRMVLMAWLPKGFDAEKRKVTLLDERKLTIVTRGSPEHLDLIEQRVGRARTRYVAEKAESFEAIAKKFGLKAADLARVNHLSPRTVLKPGEEIVVYRVIDRSRSERAEEQWKKMPKARRGKGAVAEKARGVTGRIGRDAEAVEVGEAGDEDGDEEGEDETGAREEKPAPAREEKAVKAADAPKKKEEKAGEKKATPASKGDGEKRSEATKPSEKATKPSERATKPSEKATKPEKAAKAAKTAKVEQTEAGASAEAGPVTSPAQMR